MKPFAKRVYNWKPLTVLANSSIFHIWQGSEYTSAISPPKENDSSCLNFDGSLLMALYKKYDREADESLQLKQFPNDAGGDWYSSYKSTWQIPKFILKACKVSFNALK